MVVVVVVYSHMSLDVLMFSLSLSLSPPAFTWAWLSLTFDMICCCYYQRICCVFVVKEDSHLVSCFLLSLSLDFLSAYIVSFDFVADTRQDRAECVQEPKRESFGPRCIWHVERVQKRESTWRLHRPDSFRSLSLSVCYKNFWFWSLVHVQIASSAIPRLEGIHGREREKVGGKWKGESASRLVFCTLV